MDKGWQGWRWEAVTDMWCTLVWAADCLVIIRLELLCSGWHGDWAPKVPHKPLIICGHRVTGSYKSLVHRYPLGRGVAHSFQITSFYVSLHWHGALELYVDSSANSAKFDLFLKIFTVNSGKTQLNRGWHQKTSNLKERDGTDTGHATLTAKSSPTLGFDWQIDQVVPSGLWVFISTQLYVAVLCLSGVCVSWGLQACYSGRMASLNYQ